MNWLPMMGFLLGTFCKDFVFYFDFILVIFSGVGLFIIDWCNFSKAKAWRMYGVYKRFIVMKPVTWLLGWTKYRFDWIELTFAWQWMRVRINIQHWYRSRCWAVDTNLQSGHDGEFCYSHWQYSLEQILNWISFAGF